MRVAAVQLEPVVADVQANLERCAALASSCAGAELVVLPEFFTTGMAFDPRLADAALPAVEGERFLLDLARSLDAVVGGSFICRDDDGENRNAFLLVGPDGVLGRHDKDLPTMWENAFYVGGSDDGVISWDGRSVGAAVCWEYMRSGTAARLRGRVDLMVGGSAWWSVPSWPPRAVTRRMESVNARLAASVIPAMARAVGAPVVHAAHCGSLSCPLPWAPVRYRGHYEGATMVCDGFGRVLAGRREADGPGVVVADVEVGRVAPSEAVPSSFWMHPRGPVAAFFWAYQRAHGRRWYARHARSRPPSSVRTTSERSKTSPYV